MAASRIKRWWEMQPFPGWPCAQLKILLPGKMKKKKQHTNKQGQISTTEF